MDWKTLLDIGVVIGIAVSVVIWGKLGLPSNVQKHIMKGLKEPNGDFEGVIPILMKLSESDGKILQQLKHQENRVRDAEEKNKEWRDSVSKEIVGINDNIKDLSDKQSAFDSRLRVVEDKQGLLR